MKSTIVVNLPSQEREFDFPYIFLNQEEVLKAHENSCPKKLEMMSEYIDYNAKGQLSNFKKQFVQAYITLLQSIASNKAEDLEDICEANLFNSFSFNLSQLRDLTKEAQILNFDGVIDDNILENRVKL